MRATPIRPPVLLFAKASVQLGISPDSAAHANAAPTIWIPADERYRPAKVHAPTLTEEISARRYVLKSALVGMSA